MSVWMTHCICCMQAGKLHQQTVKHSFKKVFAERQLLFSHDEYEYTKEYHDVPRWHRCWHNEYQDCHFRYRNWAFLCCRQQPYHKTPSTTGMDEIEREKRMRNSLSSTS